MAFDVEGARKAGYTEAEIVDFLGSENKIDVKAARGAGYSDAELLAELSKPATPAKAAPAKPQKGMIDTLVDNVKAEAKTPLKAARNLGLGVARGAADLVDGGMQIGLNNVAWAANKLPDNPVTRAINKVKSDKDDFSQKVEDKYQEVTKDSVAAGVGRVAGGAVLPGVGAVGQTARGLSLAAKVRQGAKAGAAVAALQPVFGPEARDEGDYMVEKAKQVAIGAGLGAAAPAAGKVVLETASKLGSKAAERSLTKTRAAQMFDKSANPKADAEVITELGSLGDRIGGRQVVTHDINARSKKVTSEAVDALKAAGGTPEEISAMKNWQGLTEAERNALKGSHLGQQMAAIVTKLDRYRALTPGEMSSKWTAPLRAALDIAPMPNAVRQTARRFLGGSQTRYETAEKLMDPRSQQAAKDYLAQHGPSDGTKGLQRLKDLGAEAQRKAGADDLTAARLEAQNKAMTDNPSMLVPSLSDPVERSEALKRLKESMVNRDKEQTKLARLKAKQNGPHPDLVVPSLRNPAESKLASKATKDDMSVRMRDVAEEAKAKQAAKDAARLKEGTLAARKVSRTPGGGAYQTLGAQVGVDSAGLNQTLRVAEKIPALREEIRKIRVEGKNTTDGFIYPITDVLRKIADDLGIPREGALTQAVEKVAPAAKKSVADRRRELAYEAGTKVRQDIYKEISSRSKELDDPGARQAVRDLVSELKTTPKIQSDRNRMIDELVAKYPQADELFQDVRHFK